MFDRSVCGSLFVWLTAVISGVSFIALLLSYCSFCSTSHHLSHQKSYFLAGRSTGSPLKLQIAVRMKQYCVAVFRCFHSCLVPVKIVVSIITHKKHFENNW